jgi:cell wall-associated NlpC family hydrolase
MTRQDLLLRARSAAGKSIIYKLGGGGMSPTAPLPADGSNQCDCSGFVCWALRMSRQTSHPLYVKINGGWINTDAIVRDATTATGFFEQSDQPLPGDLIVFPSLPPGRPVGHVGIIASVSAAAGPSVPTSVIHCSRGNFNARHDAIAETEPAVFTSHGAIFARFVGLD